MLDSITNNFLVTEVSREGNQWLVSNGEAFKKFDHIISTIPVQELILAVDAPKEVRLAAKNLKYNSLITVMIGLNPEGVPMNLWLYIPDKHVLTHRVSFPSNYSPCVAPSNESSVLAEITCIPGDEVSEFEG